jgi:hypothetical protein
MILIWWMSKKQWGDEGNDASFGLHDTLTDCLF